MKCPKCGYARRMGETAPDWQCPSCGVAYAKAEAAKGAARRSAAGGGGYFKLGLALAALAIPGYVFFGPQRQAPVQQAETAPGELRDYAKTRVIMYSLTTCGFCTAKRAELRAAGIPFVEYFLDTEPERMTELTNKLQKAGMRGGGIGTPSFEVNGVMLLNNPSLATIRKHL